MLDHFLHGFAGLNTNPWRPAAANSATRFRAPRSVLRYIAALVGVACPWRRPRALALAYRVDVLALPQGLTRRACTPWIGYTITGVIVAGVTNRSPSTTSSNAGVPRFRNSKDPHNILQHPPPPDFGREG